MPELHNAALKVLAKYGFTKDRLRRGIISGRQRNATYQGLGLGFLYDLNDPEEVKKANAVREEWGPILTQITEGKRLDWYAMSEVKGEKGSEVVVYRLTPAAAKTQLPMLGEYYNLSVKLKRMLDPNRIMNPGKFMDIEPY